MIRDVQSPHVVSRPKVSTSYLVLSDSLRHRLYADRERFCFVVYR
jgi:hypothetical protein